MDRLRAVYLQICCPNNINVNPKNPLHFCRSSWSILNFYENKLIKILRSHGHILVGTNMLEAPNKIPNLRSNSVLWAP